MERTLLTAVLGSCAFGVLLGLGVASSLLSINAWQLEIETESHEKLAETTLARLTDPNAKAFIEKTTHNFGVMDVKATGFHDFFIRNIGTTDLILMVDRVSCSCLGIDVTLSRVPPGGSAKCHLRYNAEQAITGKFTQGGIILTNDPDNREIHLRVEGVFTNPVVMRPSGVYLPRISSDATRTATIRFYGFENEPLQLSAPTWTDHEHFDFQWETAELTESDGADTYYSLAKSVIEGTITIKPGLPVGPFQEWFHVRTNYPNQTNVGFLVSGQIIDGHVAISGQGYSRSTGIVSLGSDLSRDIFIQFSGATARSASVQVRTIEPAWVDVELLPPKDIGPLRTFPLKITVPKDSPTGSYGVSGDSQQAHILLETNDETMPIIRILLQFVVGSQ